MADPPDSIDIPIALVGAEDVPVTFVNSFAIQHQADEFVLSVGQFVPPLLAGTPEQQAEQASQLPFIPVQVVGRYGLTRQRLVELIGALQDNLRKFDAR